MKNLKRALSLLIDFKRPLPQHCILCEKPYAFHESNDKYGCQACDIFFQSTASFQELIYKGVRFMYGREQDKILVFKREAQLNADGVMYSLTDSYLRKDDLLKAEKLCLL